MTSVVLGGSSVPTAIAADAEAHGIRAIRSYGLTEMPTVTGAAPDEPGARRTSTDGHGLAGVEIRIVGDDGTEAAPGDAGEIVTRGPDLFAGYTDDVLTHEFLDPDGWFATGDIGVLEDGWLTITDRKKDVIIRNGVNISPAEVENALLQLPAIAEVAVVGRPDSRTGSARWHSCECELVRRSPISTFSAPISRRSVWGARSGRRKCNSSTSSRVPRRAR